MGSESFPDRLDACLSDVLESQHMCRSSRTAFETSGCTCRLVEDRRAVGSLQGAVESFGRGAYGVVHWARLSLVAYRVRRSGIRGSAVSSATCELPSVAGLLLARWSCQDWASEAYSAGVRHNVHQRHSSGWVDRHRRRAKLARPCLPGPQGHTSS